MNAQTAEEHATKRREQALAAYMYGAEAAERTRVYGLREAEIESEVAAAQDVDGKALFSNADKRRAEVAQRLETDKATAGMRVGIEASKQAAAKASIEAQYHADLVRIACAFAQAVSDV